MPHGDEKRIVIGKEIFSKRKELLRGKLDRNQKKWMIKTSALECHAVGIIDMGYEKRRYKKTGGLRNVNMEKNGKNCWTEYNNKLKERDKGNGTDMHAVLP